MTAHYSLRKLPALLLTLSTPGFCLACATCGCTLSTDAATGYSSIAGWQVGLEYDYLNQDQLRHGSGTANAAQVVNTPADPAAGGGEIEKDTISRYLTASLAYRPDRDWSFSLLLPYVDRTHSTYGDQDAPYSPAETAPDQISATSLAGLGDIKLISAFQGFLPTRNLGLQLGLKLPTGRYGGETEDGAIVGNPAYFRSGPGAGSALDTSLQAGTGSTDLIVGSYFYQPVSQDFDVFVNGQFQAAVKYAMNQPGANFRPGNTATLSGGLRYEENPDWVPQLQINLSHKSADQGALADNANTAGTVAYLSPGLTAKLAHGLYAFGFVQLPVYSRLDGYQLFPRWTASLGLNYSFH